MKCLTLSKAFGIGGIGGIGGPPKITEIRLPGIINSALIFNV